MNVRPRSANSRRRIPHVKLERVATILSVGQHILLCAKERGAIHGSSPINEDRAFCVHLLVKCCCAMWQPEVYLIN